MSKAKFVMIAERLRKPVRMIVFFAIAGFIYLAPVPHQVFKTKTYGMPRWRMFSSMSLKDCAGAFFLVEGGADTLIDRYAALGFTEKNPPTRRDRTVAGVKQAQKVGQKLCQRLAKERGHAVDIRLNLRCPSFRAGWVTKSRGEKNICIAQPKASRKELKLRRSSARRDRP